MCGGEIHVKQRGHFGYRFSVYVCVCVSEIAMSVIMSGGHGRRCQFGRFRAVVSRVWCLVVGGLSGRRCASGSSMTAWRGCNGVMFG